MARHFFSVTVLALLAGSSLYAADDQVTVTIKGRLAEDKFGYFVQANGSIYELNFAEANRADMHRFYSELKGGSVQVTGSLYVDETPAGKTRLTVYSNDISRLQPAVVATERVVVETPAPIVVRETYVEHPRHHGVDLPGVHIHW